MRQIDHYRNFSNYKISINNRIPTQLEMIIGLKENNKDGDSRRVNVGDSQYV